ncbi:hypothetical protein, partial [Pseudoalteromonas sp. SR44-2]|uniref:hypothetical protein n=1 Tax=Pseudoalteromonas sp. SR44-2 TaxID=2760937 RepID=UPI001C724EE3
INYQLLAISYQLSAISYQTQSLHEPDNLPYYRYQYLYQSMDALVKCLCIALYPFFRNFETFTAVNLTPGLTPIRLIK